MTASSLDEMDRCSRSPWSCSGMPDSACVRPLVTPPRSALCTELLHVFDARDELVRDNDLVRQPGARAIKSQLDESRCRAAASSTRPPVRRTLRGQVSQTGELRCDQRIHERLI